MQVFLIAKLRARSCSVFQAHVHERTGLVCLTILPHIWRHWCSPSGGIRIHPDVHGHGYFASSPWWHKHVDCINTALYIFTPQCHWACEAGELRWSGFQPIRQMQYPHTPHGHWLLSLEWWRPCAAHFPFQGDAGICVMLWSVSLFQEVAGMSHSAVTEWEVMQNALAG